MGETFATTKPATPASRASAPRRGSLASCPVSAAAVQSRVGLIESIRSGLLSTPAVVNQVGRVRPGGRHARRYIR